MFKTGAILTEPKPEDFTLRAARALAIPDTWKRVLLPEIGNQLVNNCTAWGSGYAFEAKHGIKFSKDYVYGEREKDHWMGEGRRMDELMHTLLHYGNVLYPDDPEEREMPFAYDFVQAYAHVLRPKAVKYKIKAYARVYTEAEIKTALLAGMEVLCGIPVDTWYPDERGVWDGRIGTLGSHCIWVCDWSKDYPATFRCGNSWGKDWGKDGYFYASAEYLLCKQNVWAIQFEESKNEPINPVIRRTLRLKSPYMKGDDIKEAQEKLTKHGFPVGTIDGIFGKKTDAATKNFQKSRGLTVDGIIGKNTWAALDNAEPTPPDPQPIARRTLRLESPYMRGDDVKEAQEKLTEHGFPCGTIDGIFGKNTDTATKDFQRARGLTVDGIIGPKTWAELDKDSKIGRKITRFIEWLKQQIGCIYVWGAQGETDISEAWIRKRETSTDNANRAIKFWKSQLAKGFKNLAAYDCSGLIVKWLLDNGLITSDMSSRGLYSACKKITREELAPGDLVFRHNGIKIHHVGVYIGDGLVIEAKGRDDGVVERLIDASGKSYWNRYGRLGVLQDG